MAEDNTDELGSPVISVNNDSMTEDNTNELVSPITSVKNDSMAEDKTDELVNPVTSVENISVGSTPDRISTRKPVSLSNGHKVLPCYRNSSTSSYNGGNARRQSTGKLHSPDSGQDVIPHYLRASTGSCHDFCKYGKKHSSEAKPWHPPLSKRKNKLPADEHSPARTLVGEAKKETSVKQKSSTPPGSMLEEGKKVNVVNQEPSAPQESLLEDEKKVAVVEQKPASPPGSMQGGVDEVIVVEQNSSASLENMLEEGEKVTADEQELSSPPGSVQGEEKKVTLVNQKPSAPPGSMLGQGKKLNVVDQRPSPKVHSIEPSEIIKKKAPLQAKLKMVKSSSKILGGVDAGGRKVGAVDSRKQTTVSKVSAEKSLKSPTLSCSPKSSSVKPLILRARNIKSLKLLTPLKDQKKMRKDGTNKLNPEKVLVNTSQIIKVKASQRSLPQSQSRLLSNEKDKKEVVKSADSALAKYTSSTEKMSHIAEAETVEKNQKKTLRKGKTGASNDNNPSVVKLKFRRGKVLDLQQETNSPRRLTFIRGRHMGESQDSNVRKRIFKKKGVDDRSNTIPNSRKIVLRHQDVQQKKDVQVLLNNVIEETASKLVETRKSKVKALVGAFETVISLQDKPSTVTVS